MAQKTEFAAAAQKAFVLMDKAYDNFGTLATIKPEVFKDIQPLAKALEAFAQGDHPPIAIDNLRQMHVFIAQLLTLRRDWEKVTSLDAETAAAKREIDELLARSTEAFRTVAPYTDFSFGLEPQPSDGANLDAAQRAEKALDSINGVDQGILRTLSFMLSFKRLQSVRTTLHAIADGRQDSLSIPALYDMHRIVTRLREYRDPMTRRDGDPAINNLRGILEGALAGLAPAFQTVAPLADLSFESHIEQEKFLFPPLDGDERRAREKTSAAQ